MELKEAIQLIRSVEISGAPAQTWADLGCGSGLFTRALLSLLPERSTIYAVDKIDNFRRPGNNALVRFYQGDFEKDDLRLENLDGILMANSLHYVADPERCLLRLNSYLHPTKGKYILIEYDIDTGNRWVPYPLPFSRAQQLFSQAGFSGIKKIGEKKSLYRQGSIYACMISRL